MNVPLFLLKTAMDKYLPCNTCGIPVKISEKYRYAKSATCFDCTNKLYESLLREKRGEEKSDL